MKSMQKLMLLGLFLIALVGSQSANAQEGDSVNVIIGGGSVSVGINEDGTEYVEFSIDDLVSDKIVSTKWGLLDLGLNVPMGADLFSTAPSGSGFDDLKYGRSWNIDMHLFRQRVSIVKNKFNLEYGLTFSWNNYSFQNDVVPQPSQTMYTLAEIEEPLKKSKLSSTYLTVPLLLNVETNPTSRWKSFRLSAGVTGGVRIASKTKYKTEDKAKVKQKDDFNLNRWQYGPTVRIGYSWVNFYTKYDMAGFFEEGQGPELYNWTVGISVRPF
ncbi:MAG: hypothetical protein ACI959_000903 [Limisphaerales bacterium]|jgi:hypothetical protein